MTHLIQSNDPASSYSIYCFQCLNKTFGEGPRDMIAKEKERFCTKSSARNRERQWFRRKEEIEKGGGADNT